VADDAGNRLGSSGTAAVYTPAAATVPANADAFGGYFLPAKYRLTATASRNRHYNSETSTSTFEVVWRQLDSVSFECNGATDCSEVQQPRANISISASDGAALQGPSFAICATVCVCLLSLAATSH
jgi:hypothetical protein